MRRNCFQFANAYSYFHLPSRGWPVRWVRASWGYITNFRCQNRSLDIGFVQTFVSPGAK